jgi:hypothetical protein
MPAVWLLSHSPLVPTHLSGWTAMLPVVTAPQQVGRGGTAPTVEDAGRRLVGDAGAGGSDDQCGAVRELDPQRAPGDLRVVGGLAARAVQDRDLCQAGTSMCCPGVGFAGIGTSAPPTLALIVRISALPDLWKPLSSCQALVRRVTPSMTSLASP